MSITKKFAGQKARAKKQMARITADVIEKLTPEIKAEAWGEAFLLIAAFLHIDHKHGKKWILRWFTEFDKFACDFNHSGEKISALDKILKDEIKLDLAAEYEKIANLHRKKPCGSGNSRKAKE